jgi:RNA polymerase sigma-70 factor (ECF subfamily)
MKMLLELERLYDAHAAPLYAFLLNVTRDETDARDLLQEIFRRLASQPRLLDDARNERAFLLRLAHNLAIDGFRRSSARQRRHEAVYSDEPSLFAATDDPDEAVFRSQLSVALGELPAEQRMVVHLKLWEGLTFEAIADLLDVPLNTAASRYRYGIDKLRTRLRPLYDEIKHGRL